MTAVSQLLPNFIQGINEQPDELKKPGQVRDAVNVYPDITNGLLKRTGYSLITEDITTTSDGTWFSVTRREDTEKERYIFNISPAGVIKGWNADTGAVQTIREALASVDLGLGDSYFNSIDTKDLDSDDPEIEYFIADSNLDYAIKSATLADTTFLCNTNVRTSMSQSVDNVRPYEAFIEFKVIDVERAYKISFDRVGNNDTTLTQASEIKESKKIKFNTAGKTESVQNCGAAGTYTLESYNAINNKYKNNTSGDDGTRTEKIIVRVTISAQPRILKHSEKQQCDYYISNTVLLSGGQGWKKDDIFEVTIPDGPYGDKQVNMKIQYTVKEILEKSGPIDVANIAATPSATNNSIEYLQNALASAIINSVSEFDESNIEIIGNGIYIKHDQPFKIDTSEPDLINILNNQAERDGDGNYPNPVAVVNNVSNLPLECKQGFIVKVQNSFTEDDDYFVQFVRDYGDIITDNTDNTDPNSRFIESGMGYWKEIAKPGEKTTVDSGTFPHILKYRRATAETSADWIVASVDYASRTCGTQEQFTPSFVGQKINNILFYRNRLVFLSDSSVITSTAGDFTNFFPATALAVSPSDPVDVEATSNYTANLYSGIQINNAMMIFGEHNQFLLTTDSDIFSPNTAKLSQVSSYEIDTNSEPFNIGTNIGFVGKTDTLSSMYEMTNIFREGQTDVIEKSKLISTSFEADYSMVSSSKDTGLITFGKKGEDIIWLYKYFKENSQSDIQQAWFKWQLPSTVCYQILDGTNHYAVTQDGKLYKNDLESSLYQDGDVDYEMKIELPTFYVAKREQASFLADTTASLVIHRMHLNTGESGYFNISIDRYGKDSYVVEYEQSIQGSYLAGDAPITTDREQTVPLYERNTNLDITISSKFNGPFTLYSLRWEGDYNSRYYQRV